MRSLNSLGVGTENYGAILAPIIMERLPLQIRLLITRNTKDTWKIDNILKLLREELEARETCSNGVRNQEEEQRGGKHFLFSEGCAPVAASSLFSKQALSCVFCNGAHYSDKCVVVTDLGDRKAALRKSGRCYSCLRSGHLVKNCDRKKPCYYCKGLHNSAICTSNRNQVPKVNMPNSNSAVSNNCNVERNRRVLLQTAEVVVSNDKNKNKTIQIRLLCDSGSQRSFISDRVRNFLGLKTISKENLSIYTFGNKDSSPQGVDMVRFFLRGLNTNEVIRVTGFSVPYICTPIQNQPLLATKENYEHLNGLMLADSGEGNFEIDVLIGSDFYWDVFTGQVVQSDTGGPTALSSKFGWILSGSSSR